MKRDSVAAATSDFLHKPLVRAALPFINGGISGMVATTVIQPVDMIKVRIQLAGEGSAAGPKPTPLSVTREILASGKARDLYTGLSAGLLRQAVYTTARLGFFDTFMGRLSKRAKEQGVVSDGLKPVAQRKNYKSVVDALGSIARGGWRFSEAKAQLKARTEWTANAQTLSASAIAGFFASFFSLPFDFVKTRLQKQGRGGWEVAV
ncbi:putative mitochondrial 2-oxoglutarate/malate carrier protein [Collariella sp. IMI 366227]|nr:putative mitochondrial 2-oxoglutarate/malate carrier protein [Collariella sp. IMI 366227]